MGGIPVEDRREGWTGPVPVPAGVTAEFWAATLEGRLLVQRCPDCGTVQFYPRVVCTGCGTPEPDWLAAAGDGTVHSYTVCHVPGEPGFEDRVPYVVAVVELAEGPRLLAYVPADPGEVAVGDAVEARLWQVSDEAAVPVFVPA